MRACQLLSLHNKLLHLKHGGKLLHNSLMKISEALSLRTPPPHTLSTLITCITQPLMSLGLSGLHDLTSQKGTLIITVAQSKEKFSKVTAKCRIALNRLAALVNLPRAEDLNPVEIHKLLAYRSTDASTLAVYRKISYTHISGPVDIHFNAILPSTTADINLQSKSIPPTQVVPSAQPRSATHYRHEITGCRIPRTSTGKPSLTCSTAHTEFAQTNCTQQQQTNKSETFYPEPTETADIKQQQKDGFPSKRTRSKCPLTPSAHNQPSRHTHHSGAHLTQRLPHIDAHSIHQKA